MGRIKSILLWIVIFVSEFGFAQDTTLLLKPIPVFAKADSILRIAVLTSSVPHFEFSAQKLDELGATDIGQALKYVPGIQLKDYGGIGGIKTISFRSLGAGYTGVQLDGVQIPAVQSGIVNLSSFELFGLETLSFRSGQTADELVTATGYTLPNTIALKSVLNTKPNHSRMGIYSNATSINAYEAGGYVQRRLGKRFFTGTQGMLRFGNGAYKYQQPGSLATDIQTRENTALFNYRARFVLGFDGKMNAWRLDASYNNNTQELPGAAVLYNATNDQKLWNKDWRLNIAHTFSKEKWKVQNHATYQTGYTRYYDPYALNLQGFIDVDYVAQHVSVGSVVARHFRFPAERLFLGTDVVLNQLSGSNTAAMPVRLQQNIVLGGGTFLGRFRFDANVVAQLISDRFKTNQNNQFAKVSPFVAVAFIPFKNKAFRLRGFYKNTFRMPTFNDLYYNFIGNTKLKPEEANCSNLGLTYGTTIKKTRFEITADAYYNLVRNKIIAIPTKDLFNWSMQNIGKTEIYGVDLGLFASFHIKQVGINISTNHALNRSLDMTNPAAVNYKHQIPYTPYYTSSSSLSVAWKGFVFSSNVLINGFRFSLNENTFANYLPPFTDLNIGLSKTIKIKQAQALIDLKLMNVLNKNYEVIRSFPMPGRYVQLRLKYMLDT